MTFIMSEPLLVFELDYPGTWLEFAPDSSRRDIEALLHNIQDHFTEASLALNCFRSAIATPQGIPSEADWERNRHRKREILDSLLGPAVHASSFADREKAMHQAEIVFKREQWANGKVPRSFERASAFMFAKSFLYSLDGIDKSLDVLADKVPGIPNSVKQCRDAFKAAFPQLRGVRDTSHHLEDRVRKLGKYEKPLNLQPVMVGAILASNVPVLALNNLNGSKFGSTMADGHYGEVDVTEVSMQNVQSLVQDLINAFSWRGQTNHYPS